MPATPADIVIASRHVMTKSAYASCTSFSDAGIMIIRCVAENEASLLAAATFSINREFFEFIRTVDNDDL